MWGGESGLNQAKEIIRYLKFGNKFSSNTKDQEFASECKKDASKPPLYFFILNIKTSQI